MGAILISLQSLIITVRRNGLSSFFTFFGLIVLIIIWSARGNIATFLEHNPTAEQEKSRFDQSIVADAQINDTLADVRKTTNADRILIRQFHNSKTDLTGLPFASISTTYYSFAPGVTLVDGSYNAFPLATVNDLLVKMFPPNAPPHCAKMVSSDSEDATFTKYLKDNGVAFGYSCPILNLRGQPIGLIGAGYLTREKDRPDDAKIEAVLNNTGERIVGYLDNVIKKEKKPWYVAILGDETPPAK